MSESNSAEGRSLKERGIERLRALNPALSADHVRAIASFVNNSNGPGGAGLETGRPGEHHAASPRPLPLAQAVDSSDTLEGRRPRLQGFQQLYRTRPDLGEDVRAEMGRLVCGSNGIEG